MTPVLPGNTQERKLAVAAWSISVCVLLIAYHRFPLSSAVFGDEPYYVGEVEHLDRYGIYNSWSQGTSLLYSLLIFAFSKISGLGFLAAARMLSVIAYFTSGALLLACLGLVRGMDHRLKYVTLVYFYGLCVLWVWKALPDLIDVSFLLAAFYLLYTAKGYRTIIGGACLLFLGFICKPVALFALPGLALLLLLKDKTLYPLAGRLKRAFVLCIVFSCLFAVYHVPGYIAYHQLMLEDKNHSYEGITRVHNATTWGERNVYFEKYNPRHRSNKWGVSYGEVDSFKHAHPEVNLNISYSDFVRDDPGLWVGHILSKISFDLPYHIQSGFFFAKWTTVNKWIKSTLIIQLISLVIFILFCTLRRTFIRDNLLLLATPILFYIAISVCTIPQLEENWILFPLPFIALPVSSVLLRYIPVYPLLLLQLVYYLILFK